MNIPFHIGQIADLDLAAGAPGRATVGPGRWCLHARSTVPFVTFSSPRFGEREITWGDAYEVPEGFAVRIANSSAHAGDVHLSAMGSGVGAAPRAPSCVTVPAAFALADGLYTSRWVDTRTARRAYLALAGLAQGNVTVSKEHQANRRGKPFGPATAATVAPDTPSVVETLVMELYAQQIPLGIGSGQNLDTGGASLPELRPMSLLDRARVSLTAAEVDPLGFNTAGAGNSLINAFFVLEY